jgi:hypothetical protein
MIATNHALTGALVGLVIGNPVFAIPAAILSHLVCDAIPHFGIKNPDLVRSKGFARYLLVDASLCGLLVLILAISQPTNWGIAIICAFLAAAPDFLWIRWYRANLQNKKVGFNKLEQFLANIQWFEKPIGGLIEIAWFAGASALLWQFI